MKVVHCQKTVKEKTIGQLTVTNEYLYMNRINQMEDTEMVKIIMHGCNGAMGQVITKLAAEDKDAEIMACIDRVDNRENPYPVFTSCDACYVEADVIVDFSVAQAVDGVLAYALKRKMPLVLCTTGLSEKQLEDVKTASAQIPILRSANM